MQNKGKSYAVIEYLFTKKMEALKYFLMNQKRKRTTTLSPIILGTPKPTLGEFKIAIKESSQKGKGVDLYTLLLQLLIQEFCL